MPRITPHFSGTVMVGQNRVESAYLTFVANILAKHAARKRLLHEIEEGVAMATPGNNNAGMPRGSAISDPTSAAAVRLQDPNEPSFAARAHLRATIATVERIFDSLTSDQQRIISSVYIRGEKTIMGAAREIHVSKSRACRLRNQALLKFATEIVGDQILLPPG